MDEKDKIILDLKEKNAKLREQFSNLLDGYTKLELTELKTNQQADNQKRLIDFIQRIAKRLDDDDVMDVLVEEFLLELNADRVSYILPGNGPMRRLAVSNEAVEAGIKRLSLPYFISNETDEQYTQLLYKSLQEEMLCASSWKEPITLVSDAEIQLPMEQNFQMAMEEEFNVVSQVSCQVAMAYPIRTKMGGDAIVCVQRSESNKPWNESQEQLLRDMCRYAGLLLEQMQLTQKIRDLTDQLSSIIQSMPSAIIGMDLLGTINMWGGRAEDLFSISEEEALGHVLWELIPEYEFISHAMMDVMALAGEGLDFENFSYRKSDGTIRYHHANLFTMFGSNRGEIVLRVDDTTKQVELNNQLFHAQRLETVGALAGGLAHDFNNVLGGIVGTLSLMKLRTQARLQQEDAVTEVIEEAQEDMEDIAILENGAARASDMVKRLLSISRKTVIHMEPVEANSILTNVTKLCKASFNSNINIISDVASEPLWMEADATQLEQVFLNLCINARDAMEKEEKGHLTLNLSKSPITSVFAQANSNYEREEIISIKISDTGEGIELEDFDRIFDPFYTTKSADKGTGLGLSIVDKLVKEHGGIMELSSTRGVGTTFSMYFPIIDTPKSIETETVEAISTSGEGDILVVDDEDIMRTMLSRALFGMGYTVATASSGASALSMLESGLHFDLVILDVNMPIMSGLDTTRIMRNTIPNVKILYCTAEQNNSQVQKTLEDSNTWLIHKPFSLEALGKKVQECLAHKPL
jgi:PAS domain S-box-containing protein